MQIIFSIYSTSQPFRGSFPKTINAVYEPSIFFESNALGMESAPGLLTYKFPSAEHFFWFFKTYCWQKYQLVLRRVLKQQILWTVSFSDYTRGLRFINEITTIKYPGFIVKGCVLSEYFFSLDTFLWFNLFIRSQKFWFLSSSVLKHRVLAWFCRIFFVKLTRDTQMIVSLAHRSVFSFVPKLFLLLSFFKVSAVKR